MQLPVDIARILGAAALTGRDLKTLLHYADGWRPQGFTEEQYRRRCYYDGKGGGFLRGEVHRRYSATSHLMSLAGPLNWMRTFAETDAAAYDVVPSRPLRTADGEALEPDDENAKRWARTVERARLASVMIEADRRATVGGQCPIKVTYNGARGRPWVEPRWVDEVWPIPHPAWPTDRAHDLGVIARCTGPRGQTMSALERRSSTVFHHESWSDVDSWWEVWRRPVSEHTADGVKFGPILYEVLSARGNHSLAPQVYKGERLPWVWLTYGVPEGGPYVDRDRDLIGAVNTLNVALTNLFTMIEYQAHNETVLKSGKTKKASIIGGPNVVHQIGTDEDLIALDRNPKMAETRTAIDHFLKMLARSRRQSEDAYATERGAPLTGVSRKIKNQEADKKRREDILYAEAFERDELLPVLLEVERLFGPTSQRVQPGLVPWMDAREPTDLEDLNQKQQRLEAAVDKMWISAEAACVELGYYPDERTARAEMAKLAAAAEPAEPVEDEPVSAGVEDLDGSEGDPVPAELVQ